jgi:hypothetical protein
MYPFPLANVYYSVKILYTAGSAKKRTVTEELSDFQPDENKRWDPIWSVF